MKLLKTEDVLEYFYLRKWILIAYAWFFFFLLGIYGFYNLLGRDTAISPIWDLINKFYLTLQLAVLQSSQSNKEDLSLELSRWGLPALTYFALMFLFFEIAGVEVRLFLVKWIRHGREYFIISGLDRKGDELLRQLLVQRQDINLSVIEKDSSRISKIKGRSRAIFIHGDVNDDFVLKRALINEAEQIFLLFPEDGLNLNILEKLPSLLKAGKKKQLICHIHILSHSLKSIVEKISDQYSDKLLVKPFNIYDYAVASLFEKWDIATETHLHLIIIGFGRFGRTLAAKAIEKSKNIRLTVVEKEDVEISKHKFLFRHSDLNMDDKIEFIQSQIDCDDAAGKIFGTIHHDEKSIVFFCLSGSAMCLSSAMMLEKFDNVHRNGNLQIYIRAEEPFSSLFEKIQKTDTRIQVFSPIKNGISKFIDESCIDVKSA